MRTTCLLIAALILMLGCSEGVSTAEGHAAAPEIFPEATQQTSPPSRLAANPTAELVEFYLHFYDRNQQEQVQYSDLHDEVQQELIARGAETVSELLKYDYSLNKYPYSYQSSELITAIGPEARQAIPALAKSLAQGTDPTVGNSYDVDGLVAIGPESIPELITYFNGDDLHVAWAVAAPLEQLGSDVVPHLKPSLASEIPKRRRLALDTLAEIGHDAAELVPQVRHLMQQDPEYGNRVFAVRTLADIGDPHAGFSFLVAEVK